MERWGECAAPFPVLEDFASEVFSLFVLNQSQVIVGPEGAILGINRSPVVDIMGHCGVVFIDDYGERTGKDWWEAWAKYEDEYLRHTAARLAAARAKSPEEDVKPKEE